MSEPTADAFRLRLALLVYCTLQAVSSAAHAAAGRGASGGEGGRAAPVAQPEVDLAQPANSSDFMRAITADLDSVYDQYLAFKDKIQSDLNIQYLDAGLGVRPMGCPERWSRCCRNSLLPNSHLDAFHRYGDGLGRLHL